MSRQLTTLALAFMMLTTLATGVASQETTGWQQPPADIMEVLHAPQLPQV